MESADLFQRLGLALAIGFLVGVERGWKRRHEEDRVRAAGVRTYALIGLLGGVSALLGREFSVAAFVVLSAVFGTAWLAFKLFETWVDRDLSVTGVVAGLLVFALGAVAVLGLETIAAAAAVAVVVVLAFKDALHEWLRRLRGEELRSALLILSATFIALPLLPDRALDPYGAFNPREIWLLTIVIASANFLGYVALRALGPEVGLYVGAGAGALVSSTVVTLDLARRVRAGQVTAASAASAAALANAVMFARVGAMTAVFATPALQSAAPALAGAALMTVAVVAGLFLMAREAQRPRGPARLASPLDLRAVGQFALALAAITVIGRLLFHFYAGAGLFAFGAAAGLVDVDAVILAIGGLTDRNLDGGVAGRVILLAVVTDSVLKTVIVAVIGGAGFARSFALSTAAALTAGGAAFWLFGA